MSSINISDKPVKLIMENDIVSDIVYASDKVYDKINLLSDKIDKLNDPRDFFIVVLESVDNKIKGIITFEQLNLLSEKLSKNKDLNFDTLLDTTPILLGYKHSIREVLDTFEKNKNCNVILIKNNDGNYMGKVKRTNIQKRIKELLNTFDD